MHTVNYNHVMLRKVARRVDDLEYSRKITASHIRELTADPHQPDKDGKLGRGLGLPEDHVEVVMLQEDLDVIEAREKQAISHLIKLYKQHYLYSFTQDLKGVGEKTVSRLLGVIGDPYIVEYDVGNTDTGEVTLPQGPRTLKQLHSYMGLIPQKGKKKGQDYNFNHEAKMRTWLIIKSCMMTLDKNCKENKNDDGLISYHEDNCSCSKYRKILDKRRLHTKLSHPEWSQQHSLNDGMRYAGKMLTTDLYYAAKDYHESSKV